MISTRVMDIKLRETAEGLGEDSTGKKKSKFKTFKKFFGKKKRKESPSSTGSSSWKQSQAKSEVIALESGPVGYDSEDELEESRGALGSRALSHDSIFIPESGQDPARPVRVFSQENVCDRIKALQLKIQCNVKMGPPPPPGGLPAKRGDDAGMSSEDDGLPRSPPEMSLLPDMGPGTTIKATQSESLSDLTCTPEEEEDHEKPLPKVSTEENPSSRQQDVGLPRGPEPEGPATMLQPGGPRARRARLQHSPALSASAEEESPPEDNPPSHPDTPEVTEPELGPAPCSESPSLPEGSLYPNPSSENQREELPLASTCPLAEDTADGVVSASGDVESQLSSYIPEVDMTSSETDPATSLETPSGPDELDQNVQKEMELMLEVPSPEGAEKESSEAPAPSPPAPKSCLKHKAPAAAASLVVSPTPPAAEEPPPCSLDKEAAAPEPPRAEQVEAPQGVPERVAPERKVGVHKFSVSSGRGWPRRGSARPLERPGPAGSAVRLPLLRSSMAWKSEAALDDLQALPEPQDGKLDPPKPSSPAECGARDSEDRATSQAGPGPGPRDAATTPATRDPCPAAPEPPPGEDRNPFPVKLRSTSLSLKHRDVSSPEVKGMKRYSAEIRLEKGGLTVLSKDEKCQLGTAPTPRGARSPNDQGKGRARASEQLSSKPPLPRKPLLQTLTLPPAPAPPDGPGELEKAAPHEPRRESRTAEKRSPHRGAEKGLPPAAAEPGAEGQPAPPWITMARQKRRGAPEQPPNQEDRPGARPLKSEVGKQAKAPERAQEPMKQADFVRSKSFLIAPAKPSVDRREGTRLRLQEGLQRGISLSHQNLAAQSAIMMEKELHQLKRASYASTDQPSWMELARKKSQAWSDMPQIIK
uniref:CRACD like n=1 Tax=Equus caballus TaxID=9796 RepID=A0A9L0SYZ2_HORSE